MGLIMTVPCLLLFVFVSLLNAGTQIGIFSWSQHDKNLSFLCTWFLFHFTGVMEHSNENSLEKERILMVHLTHHSLFHCALCSHPQKRLLVYLTGIVSGSKPLILMSFLGQDIMVHFPTYIKHVVEELKKMSKSP